MSRKHKFTAKALFAHPFQKDGATHVVFTARPKVKRNGRKLSLCGLRIDSTFRRLAPSIHRMGLTAATCDGCVASLTGIFEVLQQPPRKIGANNNA